MLDKKILNNYAKLLVDFSLPIRKNDNVIVNANIIATPLVEELYKEILKKSAFPFLRLALDNQTELFYENCSEEQLKILPNLKVNDTRLADAFINILSEINTKSLTHIRTEKQMIYKKTNKPISDMILKKDRWTLALYPTIGYAQDAEMSISKFEEFVVKALKLDAKNPINEWIKQREYQEKVIKSLKNADEIKIIGERTNLTLSVKNRIFINSFGMHNMPSGEVFTGPIETSANGYIFFDIPTCLSGNEVQGVYLEFAKGKVINATAEKNELFLLKALDTDAGAKFLGEFAFGLNYSIQKSTKNILFDEKIGGTIHLALGNSYPETGGKNKSALHWDLIKDLRKTGEVLVNNRTVFKRGKFIF